MSKNSTEAQAQAQAQSEDEYLAIPMKPVNSSQITSIGYSLERKTLAVSFTRGSSTVYQYPNIEPKTHADFVGAESIGKYFGAHIKPLPFKKFKAPEAA